MDVLDVSHHHCLSLPDVCIAIDTNQIIILRQHSSQQMAPHAFAWNILMVSSGLHPKKELNLFYIKTHVIFTKKAKTHNYFTPLQKATKSHNLFYHSIYICRQMSNTYS